MVTDKWYLLVDNGIGNDENRLFELVLYTDYRVKDPEEVSKFRDFLCKQDYDNSKHKDTKEYQPNYMVITDPGIQLEQFVKYVLGEKE